jgi:hypothetical protein
LAAKAFRLKPVLPIISIIFRVSLSNMNDSSQ